MPLPRSVIDTAMHQGDLLGLKMGIGGASLARIFWWRLEDEEPGKLTDFSITTATAQATAGTGWNEILKSGTNSSFLEPDRQGILNQVFWSIDPPYAWVYLQYPTGQDRRSILGTRAIGDQQGYFNGVDSPVDAPSPATELWVPNGTHPAFNGYHPYLEPATITIRLSFYMTRFNATLMTVTHPWDPVPQGIPGIFGKVRVKTVGGLVPVGAPQWIIALGVSSAPDQMSDQSPQPPQAPLGVYPQGMMYGRQAQN